MPIDSGHFMPSLIPDLMARHEWDTVQQYLTLADLGRLRLVSQAFSAATTPEMLEQAAWGRICQDEGERVTDDILRQFPVHPQAKKFLDNGYLATACIASVHYVLNDLAATGFSQQESLVPCRVPAMQRESKISRDGYFIVRGDHDAHSWIRVNVRSGESKHLEIPRTVRAIASCHYMARLFCGKDFLVHPADWWLLDDLKGGLHMYNATASELASSILPKIGISQRLLGDVSCNGRFVATVSVSDQENSLIQGYDREQDYVYVYSRIGDNDFYQISVADDGDIYVGAYQRGYIFNASGRKIIHNYGSGFNNLFRLSSDGRFLVRSVFACALSGRAGNAVLEDRALSREIILPRTVHTRPGFWSSRPIGIAFSVFNALVALVYVDGLIQVFDLYRVTGAEARLLLETSLPWAEATHRQPVIYFEGLDHVHVLYPERERGHEGGMIKHTLILGQT